MSSLIAVVSNLCSAAQLKYQPRCLFIIGVLTIAISAQLPANATEAVIIGGGSTVHDSHARFEDSVRYVKSVLSDEKVTVTTYFNDGNLAGLDIYSSIDTVNAIRALERVFDDGDLQARSFRNHTLRDVHASTHRNVLEDNLNSHLASNSDDELLLVQSGYGSYPGANESNVSMHLWNNTRLSAADLHQWLTHHERPIRFVMAHSHSGGFHRLAYLDPSAGLALNDPIHCGFTSSSSYSRSEIALRNGNGSDYRDYLSYFFSAISGYEHTGVIISRFSDLNDDGHTSLREAHLFSLEEAMSMDLPLSTSEDYLLRWQPWFLRWQPAPKLLPNNEYSRIFRDVANRMNIPLDGNVAKQIRSRLALVTKQLQTIRQKQSGQNADIAQLQAKLQAAVVAQWPALNNPYSKGFQSLINAGDIPTIESFIEQQQPDYSSLQALQDSTVESEQESVAKQREAARLNKLLLLRHLALVKQQLFQHATPQQTNDYRALVQCEEAPLTNSVRSTIVSEDSNG